MVRLTENATLIDTLRAMTLMPNDHASGRIVIIAGSALVSRRLDASAKRRSFQNAQQEWLHR
jgi:hypothetical protein